MPLAPFPRAAQLALLALLLVASLVVLPFGCGSRDWATQPALGKRYVLVTLKRGPRVEEKSAEERQRIQTAHLANIRRLAEQGTLVVAGPYGQDNHDPTQRGIFIFDVPTIEEAKSLTATDPAVIEGVLAMECEELVTDANLRAAIDAEHARDADERARGVEPKMGEHIRPYVILRTGDARAEQAKLLQAAPSATIINGTTGDGRGFRILDARETKVVREWLGGTPSPTTTLDEWYASDLLVRARGVAKEMNQ
jgi:uncharacterized protein YciI